MPMNGKRRSDPKNIALFSFLEDRLGSVVDA